MSWTDIESDPGVFTELISGFGTKNIQVLELFDMYDEKTIEKLKPVYGLIFLFKYNGKLKDTRKVINEGVDGLFFANQIVTNACATQAIISILLNTDNIELGDSLGSFKDYAFALDPMMRGETIGQHDVIRKVHNSFARPEPFIFEESKDSKGGTKDVYHFVSYIPYKGRIYELDGLKKGPIDLGEVKQDQTWYGSCLKAIQERVKLFAEKGDVGFSLMAVCKDRIKVLDETLNLKKGINKKILEKLQDDTKHNDLPSGDALKNLSRQTETMIQQLENDIKYEVETRERSKKENIRRKHDYVAFTYNLLQLLAKKGELKDLRDKSKAARKKRADDKAAKEKKAKEAKEKKEKEAKAKKEKEDKDKGKMDVEK